MSRIGKKPVAVPSGITANVEGQTVKMKGPKGALSLVLADDVTVKMDKGAIKVDPRSETLRARAMWGTSRTLVANLVTGVTKGFEDKLEITGVGYRAKDIGAVFLGGGLHFVKQSFDAAKNPLQCALFALIGVGVGLWLCLWAITGIPDGIPDF